MNASIVFFKHPESRAQGSDIPRVLAAADAYLKERAQPPAPGFMRRAIGGVLTFLKGIGQTRARQEMLAEALRIEASRPGLARQLRRSARGSWLE